MEQVRPAAPARPPGKLSDSPGQLRGGRQSQGGGQRVVGGAELMLFFAAPGKRGSWLLHVVGRGLPQMRVVLVLSGRLSPSLGRGPPPAPSPRSHLLRKVRLRTEEPMCKLCCRCSFCSSSRLCSSL